MAGTKAQSQELVDVTKELAQKIEVYRAKEGGFQRKLDQRRLPEMVRALGEELGYCPPISIAVVEGRHVLVDGQHRFAAWQLKAFPLKATVTRMSSMDEAIKAFISLNRKQKKVSLTHILNVSNEDYAVKSRRMAADCKVSIGHIHNLMCGVLDAKDPFLVEVGDAHWALAAKVMAAWMKNRRWGNEGSVYSNLSVLKLVGYYAGKAKTTGAVDAVLKDLQSLDYSRGGKIGRIEGTSWAQQSKMKDVFHKYMAEKILG